MAHPQLDELLDYCLKFAQDMLRRYGEYYPFAATIDPAGALVPIAVYTGGKRDAIAVYMPDRKPFFGYRYPAPAVALRPAQKPQQ